MPASAKQVEKGSIWTLYRVRWEFLTRLCGSTPADPEMIRKWIESRQPKVKPAEGKSIQKVQEEVLAHLPEVEPEYSMLVFQRHEGRLVERFSTIRSHIKDCARVISAQYVGRIKGERAFSTRVINGVYVDHDPYWVPVLNSNGKPVKKSSGFQDKAVHVRGPRGEPLNALKRIEYVEPPSAMEFTLKVLGKSVTESDLHTIMEYGGTHGYAGERGDDGGRYSFEITAAG